MDNQPGTIREMALFAGAGGGILGGHLLGWKTVCAVEWEPYPACVLVARQNDKILPPFPIWDDVETFDGKPWRGLVDVVSGGFPCQDISSAGGGQELTELGQACGAKWHELSAKYDLNSCSWRTHQCLWDEELHWSSVTLPRWGMTVSGVLFQHPTAERPINGTGSGLWATPTTMDKLPPKSAQALHREATIARPGRSKPANLRDQVSNMNQWPTPQASDNRDRGNLGSPATLRRKEKGKQISLGQSVSDISGALNPPWVEWLMAWPLGWTDLKPLAMDKFQSWQQQHSVYCEADE